MARGDPHFRLRIPDDLRERIREEALNNHHSMTAEIVARLRRSFEKPVNFDGEQVSTLNERESDLLKSVVENVKTATDLNERMDRMMEIVLEVRKEVLSRKSE